MRTCFFLFMCFFCEYSFGFVRNVPVSYSSISIALDSAQTGDTILVAPGTYFENIIWPRTSSLKLFSSGGASNTIIDGSGTGKVLFIINRGVAIDSTTIIKGFQIVNGYNDLSYAYGGGIYIDQASPTLSNLDVHDNNITSYDYAFGAGIYCGSDSYSIIEECQIHDNVFTAYSYGGGAGINGSIYSYLKIKNCNIYDNVGIGLINGSGDGVGISIDPFSTVIIKNTTVENNISEANGSWGTGIQIGSYCDFLVDSCRVIGNICHGSGFHYGTGILIQRSSGVISNTEVLNNQQYGSGWLQGVGILIDESVVDVINTNISFNKIVGQGIFNFSYGAGFQCENNSVVTLDRTTISGNSINDSTYNQSGGGIYCKESTLALRNVLLSDNSLGFDSTNSQRGAGICSDFSSGISIWNSSIVNNYIFNNTQQGSGVYIGSGMASMSNSISWNPLCSLEVVNPPGNFNISYSDVRSGNLINGNINSDPQFVGQNDYHLGFNSPCINAGVISGAPNDDLEGITRPLPAGTNPDMGAYEMDQPVGVNNFETNSQSSVFPNPVETKAVISLNDLNDKIIQVKIFDELGQTEIIRTDLLSDSYVLQSEELKSGVYFYQLTTRSGKFIKGKFVVN